MDGIDLRFQETNEPRPTARAQLESVVDEWRRFPAEYDSLLRRAEDLRSDAAALPVREVQEMWAVLVEGLRLRADGTRETVRLFDGVLREEVDPKTAGARLDELSEELDRVNARFSSLAEKYNAGVAQR